MANAMIPPMDPQQMAAMGMPNPFAPPPPPSPSLGFQIWASNPQNAHKVQPSMTAPDAPLQPNAGQQPAPVMASVRPPVQSQMGADQAELQRLQHNGAGVNQIHNGFLRGLAKVGDVAGTVLAPGVMAAVPGTTVHNWQLQNMQQGRVASDQAALQGAAQLSDTESQTAQRNALGNKAQAQADAVPDQTQTKQDAQEIALASHGLKRVTGPNGRVSIVPDEESQVFKQGQLKDQLIQSQMEMQQAGVELKKAQTALAASKNDPNSPAYKQAAQRLATAQQNATAMGIRAKAQWGNYLMHAQGVGLDGNPLAGAMLTDNGDTVGSAFSQNVRPTGTERNKGDMAASAAEQLGTIKEIVQKNPQMFGPGYGQSTAFQKWLGSQDPDAQRFLSARTIAADHLSGTFGGHSEYATKAIDDAIGQFKDNPQAALAGIDQLTGANARFQRAGTVKTMGNKSNPMKPPAQGAPAEGATKKNSAGDTVVFHGGKWGPA